MKKVLDFLLTMCIISYVRYENKEIYELDYI